MKQSKRLFALLLTLAMTLGMLTACGGGNSDTSSEGDGGESSGSNELTVYTAFPEAEVAYYFNAFEEATGIKVNALRLSAGEMLTRVAAEKDNPQASPDVRRLHRQLHRRLQPGPAGGLSVPELSNTPENYLDPTACGTPSMWAPSPSPATRTGSRTKGMIIPPAGMTCWIPSIRI